MKLITFEGNNNSSLKTELGNIILPEGSDIYWFSTVLSYATFFNANVKSLPKVSPAMLAPEVLACGLYPCGQVWSDLTVTNGALAGDTPSSYIPC
jgi:hypothetical protein